METGQIYLVLLPGVSRKQRQNALAERHDDIGTFPLRVWPFESKLQQQLDQVNCGFTECSSSSPSRNSGSWMCSDSCSAKETLSFDLPTYNTFKNRLALV